MHEDDIFMFLAIKMKDLFINIHDRHLVDVIELSLDVIFGEEEFDDPWGAYHYLCF